MPADEAREIARRWNLEPHPEGGYYRETYRAAISTTPPGYPGPRALATAILFLLPGGVRSLRHRVRGDELWLWQGGDAMALDIDGATQLIGPDADAGHALQALVPANTWQSATPAGERWSLVACVVAPGFDFADFEISD
jgi:predicted cupin superfamily sugar epimerase